MPDSPIGRWTSTKNSRVFLELSEDGSLKGSDGANAIVSTWSTDSSAAIVASFITTQRAAQGMETWVGRTHRVEADGDELYVFDRSGNQVGTLVRADATAEVNELGRGR